MSLVFGQGVVDWVDSKIPGNPGFDQPQGLGILQNGALACAVVFDNWRPATKSVFASIAVENKTALTRGVLSAFFDYGFNHLGCKRITCLIDKNNEKSIKLCSRIGFIQEGTLRQAAPSGNDLLIFGMLEQECRWLSTNS